MQHYAAAFHLGLHGLAPVLEVSIIQRDKRSCTMVLSLFCEIYTD